MPQAFYTLDEAARILGMEAEKLTQMAQKREIRSFADRGTFRFRSQDVEELARRLGLGSSPDLQLGEKERAKAAGTPSPRPKGPKSPAPKSPAKPGGDEGVFDFSLSPGDELDMGHEAVIESPSSSQRLPSKGPGSHTPTPKPGSDSDVHLVFDVADDVTAANDSDVRLEDAAGPSSSRSNLQRKMTASPDPSGPRSNAPRKMNASPDPASSKSNLRKKTMMPPGARPDSGVRLVPMDDDASVPLGEKPPSSATESDIRLAESSGVRPLPKAPSDAGSGEDLGLTTEEIDLDAELRKAAEMAQTKKPRSKIKPKTGIKQEVKKGPVTSPFELAETGLELPKIKPSAPTSLRSGPKDEMQLEPLSDEDVNLGDPGGARDLAAASGINLHKPADSGINLEKADDASDDSLEFELSLDPEATPKPSGAAQEVDSSGEFELTLDDTGGLAPIEEDNAGAKEGEKDIFETDFDMPALDEESASEAVALDDADTELESSDFDLSLGEESGSQVVALDEEEADEGAATVAARSSQRRAAKLEAVDDDAEEIEDLLSEEGEDEAIGAEDEEELQPRRTGAVAAAPANWGVLPVIALFPSVVILFFLGVMSFELLHGMWGYKQPYKTTGMLVKWLSETVGEKVPD